MRFTTPASLAGRPAWDLVDSPLGPLLAVVHDGALRELRLPDTVDPGDPGGHDDRIDPAWDHAPAQVDAVRSQLGEYFAGARLDFDLTCAPTGTGFQLSVWRALARIPPGTTASYSEVARAVGRPTAVRAVGSANGANPIPIVVPCHRVIASDGSLGGYGGGPWRKLLLLEVEGVRSAG